MTLPVVGVTRYVTPLREGGSLPGIVEAEDLGTYVCKFRGAGQGAAVLVAEVVVGEIARHLGLATPRQVVLDLDPDLARYEADEEVQDLLNASPGLNLGIDFLPGAFGFDGDLPVPRRGRGHGAVARRLLRQRRPELAQPQPAVVARRPLGDRPRRQRSTSTTPGPGGVTDPERFARQPWDAERPRAPALAWPPLPDVDETLGERLGEDVFRDGAGRRARRLARRRRHAGRRGPRRPPRGVRRVPDRPPRHPPVAAHGGGRVTRRSYQYVVLRCVPRVDREEFLNVGVLVYCEADGYLEAAWQVDRERLLALDPRSTSTSSARRSRSSTASARATSAGERPPGRRWAPDSASSRLRAARSSSPAPSTAASPPTPPASSNASWSASSAETR